MNQPVIVGLGEVLWDLLPHGKFLGGAPANFAFHASQLGAEGIVDTLLRNGAIGLVTTHDLALAAIAEKPESQAFNVHFEDQIIDGRIQFDYRMKPGVVKTSNALALMRAVGLDVPQR